MNPHMQNPSEQDQNLRYTRMALIGGLAFGIVVGAYLRVTTGSWYYGFHGGFFCGFVFGWATKKWLKGSTSTPQLESTPQQTSFDGDENVVHSGPANHFKGIEAVGGSSFSQQQPSPFSVAQVQRADARRILRAFGH